MNALLLALRYMRYYWVRSVILVVCVSVAIFLPLAVHVLVGYYNRIMIERSDRTPLVIGAKGSAYDLVLSTVYFKGKVDKRLTMAHVRAVDDSGLATAVPIHVRYTAGKLPVVGTTLDYFAFRGLRVEQGTLPQVLGDVVLGAAAAKRLALTVGDRLLSDREKTYDISAGYPLLMRVVGVLCESGTADDRVVFTDVRTTWVIEGIGHGHVNAAGVTDPSLVRGVVDNTVVMSGAETQYSEITPENIDRFHFHGDDAKFPVTAVIALPRDAKSTAILKARYRLSDDARAVVPRQVVRSMMAVVARVKRFLDAIFAMVLASTGLFLVLVILLSLRIRRRERQTLHRIGCSRGTVFAMQTAEIAVLLAVSLIVAAATLGGVFAYVVWSGVLL